MIRSEEAGARAISLKLGPGESIPDALIEAVDAVRAPGAAVVSAIGSLSEVSYLLVTVSAAGRPEYTEPRVVAGAIEAIGLQGHIGRTEDGTGTAHLHGVFGLESGEVVGGHLLDAKVLVTFQATLLVASGVSWDVRPYVAPEDERERPARQMNIFVPGAAKASEESARRG